MVLWCDINRTTIDKNVTNWFQFNNTFETKRLTVNELINEIIMGHSYTTVHRKDNIDTKTARHVNNFMFAQHFALDFDGNDDSGFVPTMNNVSQIPIVKKYASFIHQTASNTDETPRCRAVFVLESAESNAEMYSAAMSYINGVIGTTDASCTDPVRVFFGAKGKEYLYLGNVISNDVFREWGSKWKDSVKRPANYEYEVTDTSLFRNYVETAIASEVSSLANEASGSRHNHLLVSATKLASIMKSSWSPVGILTPESITGMLMAACYDNGLVKEDGQKSVYSTIEDGILNSTPRPQPPHIELKRAINAHDNLPISLDITTLSEMDRIYSAYRAGRIAGSLWSDIGEGTIEKLGIVFTGNSVVIPFIDIEKIDDIATKDEGGEYTYQVGTDTVLYPKQPNSSGKIAIVTKNPEDITVLFDRMSKHETPYDIFGTSEIGRIVANRLSDSYDEVIFLTQADDPNIEVAKKAIRNSGVLQLQGTVREMYGWGLNTSTLNNMLKQAW